MNNKTMLIILLVFTLSLSVIGCSQKSAEPLPNKSINTSINKTTDILINESCKKEDNCCLQNEDCWSTNGGCFTHEWFAKADAKARKQGIDNLPPTSTPNVNCTCDNNKCVIHN